MATTRKPAARSATAPVKPVVAVKPSTKLAATPAGRSAAARVAKDAKAGGKQKAKDKSGKPGQAAAPTAATADKAARQDKPKKPKLLRDSFTIPKSEYAVLAALKARANKGGRPVKKSELLRAGIKALAALPDVAFMAALGAVPALKAGRDAKA